MRDFIDEVLEAIEARRDPALKLHTQDDLVQVHYSEILVLEEEIERLRGVVAAAKEIDPFIMSRRSPEEGGWE